MTNIHLSKKTIVATMFLLALVMICVVIAWIYIDKEIENSQKINPLLENVSTNKLEEDLKKTEVMKDARPVKAPQDSLLEGKYLTPPPAN